MNTPISCKQAVDFISKEEEASLSTEERIALSQHLAECSLCRIFSVQNNILVQAAAQEGEKLLTASDKKAIVDAVFESNSK